MNRKHTHVRTMLAPTGMPSTVFDEDGFLLDASSWTQETSRLIAEIDGISPLTPDHWAIISYLREHHLKNGTLPVEAHVCWANHLRKDAVKALFGGFREAWRVAGLPNPGEEAKTYMN